MHITSYTWSRVKYFPIFHIECLLLLLLLRKRNVTLDNNRKAGRHTYERRNKKKTESREKIKRIKDFLYSNRSMWDQVLPYYNGGVEPEALFCTYYYKRYIKLLDKLSPKGKWIPHELSKVSS